MSLYVIPVTFRQACAFVAELHRHNKPPRGHKFSIGLCDGDRLVGVVMVGRPVARALDDGLTCEINRTCTRRNPERQLDAVRGGVASISGDGLSARRDLYPS